ncbi:MAG: sensor domain-containing diguanylate cyclase [Gammaproteobacteria bacterium]|nr:sensor domain-containing diguanylate cyclase [Gammaproteobacteria bacterium]
MNQKKISPQHRILALQSELRDRAVEIELLKETADAVSSELDLKKVLALIVERARSLIMAETVLIPILDADCAHYTYQAGCGKNADEIVGESLPLDLGVCGWVWRHKRAWWRGVLEELDAAERNKWEKEAGTVILVPLFGKRHFLGGLAGINKIGGGDFTRRDLDLLTLFANQVSFAIENATFFEEMNKAREQAERYQRELQNLNAELEQRVLQRTAALADAMKELEHRALHDTLTGLPNRALFHDRLRQGIAAARRESKPLTLMMIDLDRFKNVNDTHGHDVGDQLLKEVSLRWKNSLRQMDTLSRIGGDEFVIVLPSTNTSAAILVAHKLLKALEAPFMLDGQPLVATASLGIAVYPQHAQDIAALYKCADAAMYTAKRRQTAYFVFHPDDKDATGLSTD